MISTVLGSLFLLLILYTIHKICTCGSEIPSHLPWVGQDVRGPFKRSRSYVRSIFGTRAMLEEGYEKYSKYDQAFVLPNMFTGAEILLPASQTDWLHNQSEEHFNGLEAHRQFMRGDYTLLHPLMCSEHVFEDAIKKHLTRGLDVLLPSLADEVNEAVKEYAGLDTENWKEIDSFGFWKQIMVRSVSRLYVGLDLGRNTKYLHHAGRFNQMVIFNAGLIGALPRFLRPILAPLILIPDKYHHRRASKLAAPVIADRLSRVKDIVAREKTPDFSGLPHDLITWSAIDAIESPAPTPEKATVDFLCRRLSVMTFVSTDSTTITLGNVLFDILLAPCNTSDFDLMAQVQEELQTAYAQYLKAASRDPDAAKRFIDQSLPLLDSCIKESFRLRNFISRGLVKTATRRSDEIHVPGVGYVPESVKIGIPIWGIHHDEKTYKDAGTWRCHRWLEDDEKKRLTPITGGGSAEMVRAYLPFGFKRFSCPGRFYAVRLVKMILINFLLKYDIKLAGSKPPVHYWWGISVSPPRDAGFLIRRKLKQDSASFL